ncbi:MAG: hypothetical protein U9P38_08135 [Campylobacterota bacterium]|nr:hypothetical protein [Campylobacterota bacterium]
MKKIVGAIVGLSLLVSSAKANMFIGADYILENSMTYETEYEDFDHTFESDPIDISGYSILLGWGSVDTSSFRIYYSLQETEYDYEQTEYGFNHRLYFDAAKKVKWSIQYGLGLGELENEELENYVIGNIGLGLSYLLNKNVEFSLGYDMKYTQREEDYYTQTGTGSNIYLGVSYWFGESPESENRSLPRRRDR